MNYKFKRIKVMFVHFYRPINATIDFTYVYMFKRIKVMFVHFYRPISATIDFTWDVYMDVNEPIRW